MDARYSKAVLITERPVPGVDSLELVYADEALDTPLDLSSAVIFLDLKDHWSRLTEILQLQRPLVLTGISPYTSSELAKILDNHFAYTGYMEFDERGDYVRETLQLRDNKALVFRVHNLKSKEYPNYDLDRAVTRYVRAVRERSVDALLFLTPANEFDYESFVRTSASKLAELNLVARKILSPRVEVSRFLLLSMVFVFVLILSFSPLLALATIALWIFSPVIGLPFAVIAGEFAIYFSLSKKVERETMGILIFFMFSIYLGLAVNSAMISPAYQNGLEVFRGVKVSLIALPGFLFIKGFLKSAREKLSFTDIVLTVIVVLAGVYYVLRSGNFSFVSSLERELRDFLDNALLVRPRFKELLAYPLLAISIRKNFSVGGKLGSLIVAGGSICIVSVVNTFCHATVPIWTGLLRSCYGMVFGLIFAIILMMSFKKTDMRGEDEKESVLNTGISDESN